MNRRRTRYADLTPEQRERERARKRVANMTPEQRERERARKRIAPIEPGRVAYMTKSGAVSASPGKRRDRPVAGVIADVRDTGPVIGVDGMGGVQYAAAPAAPRPPTLDDERAAERARRGAVDTRASLRRALERIDELDALVSAYERYTAEPLRPIEPATLRRGKRPAVAVALLSDVHAEERVTRTEAIDNEYSIAIAERRVARFFAAVPWLVRQASTAFDVGAVVLWLGGDLISGDIHDELLERCEIPPGEATLRVRDWIAAGLRSVLDALPRVTLTVPCSAGNHGRTTDRMRAATGYGHSWEWLLYQVLGHDFRNEPRVRIHATRDEMQYVTALGRTLAFHHGHRMRYNGGIGGLTIPAIKAVYRWQAWRDADYYHFGHFHTRLDLGQIAFNGSVIGPSPYGFAIGAAPEPPQQSFYLLDDKRGKTMASPVWVAE